MILRNITMIASSVILCYAIDAGSINKNIEQQMGTSQGKQMAKPQIQSNQQQATKADTNGVKFVVNSFKISGNTMISTQELEVLLSGYKGNKYTFAQLQNALMAVAEHYQQNGFNARAFFPPQEIKDGIIELMILEGKLSSIDIDATTSKRLQSSVAKGMIEEQHKVGDTLNLKNIEKGLMIVGELPGTKPSSRLASGDNTGETKLEVKLEDTNLISGNVGLSNSGSKSTGIYQTSAVVMLNSPTAVGDLLTFQGMKTLGVDYGKVAYSVPFGTSGLKLGLNTSIMEYKVTNGTEADGESRSRGVNFSYPLIRDSSSNMDLIFAKEHKSYLNRSADIVSSDKTNDVYTSTLSGMRYDEYGQSTYSIAFSRGEIDLSRIQSDYETDKTSAKTNGNFAKAVLNLSRSQIITDDTTLSVSAMVQKARDNLDSGEKIYLGGVSGVRAYPNSEAGGDEGWTINAEVNKRLPYGFSVKAFYDIGQIKQHHNLYDGWQGSSSADNVYMLRGAGVGAGYSDGTFSAQASLAYKQGTNPNTLDGGKDNDGTDKNPRLWFSLTKTF